MIAYEDTGTKESYIQQNIGVIGSGNKHAAISYETLKLVRGLSTEEQIRIILLTTIKKVKDCGFPIVIWRVTPKGIDKIEDTIQGLST